MASISQARQAPPANIRTPLFVLGVALSLIAFLVMFAFGLIYAGKIQTPGQTSVVVAATTIDPKTPIDPSLLKLVSIPTSAVPPNVFVRTKDLAGDYAVVTIYQGEPVTANLVSDNADLIRPQAAYLPIPSGFVAMSLPATEVKDVSGYPAQDDYIDVIASVPLKLFIPGDTRSVEVYVFTKLKIIRVGPQSTVARQGQPQGVASSIVVLLSPCDAVFMEWLQENTTLTFTLRSYKDYGTTPSPSPASSPSPSTSSSAAASSNAKCPNVVGPAEADGRWKFTSP